MELKRSDLRLVGFVGCVCFKGGVCHRDVVLSLDFLQGFGGEWMEGN